VQTLKDISIIGIMNFKCRQFTAPELAHEDSIIYPWGIKILTREGLCYFFDKYDDRKKVRSEAGITYKSALRCIRCLHLLKKVKL